MVSLRCAMRSDQAYGQLASVYPQDVSLAAVFVQLDLGLEMIMMCVEVCSFRMLELNGVAILEWKLSILVLCVWSSEARPENSLYFSSICHGCHSVVLSVQRGSGGYGPTRCVVHYPHLTTGHRERAGGYP